MLGLFIKLHDFVNFVISNNSQSHRFTICTFTASSDLAGFAAKFQCHGALEIYVKETLCEVQVC